MKSPEIGLKSNTKSTVIDLLNARLADAIDLSLLTKQAHWNLRGPGFIGIHEMLDEFRDTLDTHTDTIAERVAQLDGIALGTSQVVAATTTLPPYPTEIRAVPYEAPSTTPFELDKKNDSYDREYIERFRRVLISVDDIFEEFRGRFIGKSTPSHVFWHSFDVALTRFSGRPAPVREGAGEVEREAYSHEVISFGFWAGDDKIPEPAFYCYTAPEPEGLTDEKLRPDAAHWESSGGGHLALLMYDKVREEADPRETVLDFLESAYQAGAKRAGWDTEKFKLPS